jgi:hypothetical protein
MLGALWLHTHVSRMPKTVMRIYIDGLEASQWLCFRLYQAISPSATGTKHQHSRFRPGASLKPSIKTFDFHRLPYPKATTNPRIHLAINKSQPSNQKMPASTSTSTGLRYPFILDDRSSSRSPSRSSTASSTASTASSTSTLPVKQDTKSSPKKSHSWWFRSRASAVMRRSASDSEASAAQKPERIVQPQLQRQDTASSSSLPEPLDEGMFPKFIRTRSD